MGLLYDRDSSDFKGRREEEEQFNAKLAALARDDRLSQTWQMDKDYEDELRRAIGETRYLELCEKHGRNKALRARLIAADEATPIPEKLIRALEWTADRELVT